MASDLDFSKTVQQIPDAAPLARPYQRTITAETSTIPDFQGALSNYADATNWMSSIGSKVAKAASDRIAERIGGELGKNPKGDIGISLTDFDSVMHKSYQTQAQSTLGIQAYKLISDSNIELSKLPRLTPDVIAKTQQSISTGLKNIFENAPNEIRPQLESTYGHQQLSQISELNNRMIGEQKEDQRNTTAYASEINAENAYSFGIKGNDKAAKGVLDSTIKANQAAVSAKILTPLQAKVAIDSARKSYDQGKLIHDYNNAQSKEEFLKNRAEKGDISNPDYMEDTQHLMAYVSQQQSLRSQDEQLKLARFNVSIAKDPVGAGTQLPYLKEELSPIQYEQAQLQYIKGLKSFYKTQGELNFVASNWGSPEEFARMPEKAINHGFDALVTNYMQQQNKKGNAINQDQAEVQVAAAAGGRVPYFENSLKNKINSGNPDMMNSAAIQMHDLREMNASHALIGIDDHDKRIITQFDSLRSSLPAPEAARIAIENANQDPETLRMSTEKWGAFIKSQTGGVFTIAPSDWALKKVGLNKNDFMNPGIANEYGNMVLQNYRTHFINLKGDRDNAFKLAREEAEQNFGYTGVNGSKFMTLHPIEKILGYADHPEVVPFIQQDVMNRLNARFLPMKEQFSKNEVNEYWDIVPHSNQNKSHVFGHSYEPVKVRRVMRSGKKTTTDMYDVVLIGNSFNWDIALNTSSGLRPLGQIAPYLGIHTYTPDKKAIDAAYLKANGHR